MLTHSTKTIVRELLAREIRELEKHLAPYKIDEVESYGLFSFDQENLLAVVRTYLDSLKEKKAIYDSEVKSNNVLGTKIIFDSRKLPKYKLKHLAIAYQEVRNSQKSFKGSKRKAKKFLNKWLSGHTNGVVHTVISMIPTLSVQQVQAYIEIKNE